MQFAITRQHVSVLPIKLMVNQMNDLYYEMFGMIINITYKLNHEIENMVNTGMHLPKILYHFFPYILFKK